MNQTWPADRRHSSPCLFCLLQLRYWQKTVLGLLYSNTLWISHTVL